MDGEEDGRLTALEMRVDRLTQSLTSTILALRAHVRSTAALLHGLDSDLVELQDDLAADVIEPGIREKR